MTRRSLLQRAAAALAFSWLARTPLAGWAERAASAEMWEQIAAAVAATEDRVFFSAH